MSCMNSLPTQWSHGQKVVSRTLGLPSFSPVCVWAGTGRSEKGVCMMMMEKTTMSLSSLTCSSSVKLNKADTANTGQRSSKVERHNADQTDI